MQSFDSACVLDFFDNRRDPPTLHHLSMLTRLLVFVQFSAHLTKLTTNQQQITHGNAMDFSSGYQCNLLLRVFLRPLVVYDPWEQCAQKRQYGLGFREPAPQNSVK